MKTIAPLYMVSPEDPNVKGFGPLYERMAEPDMHTARLRVEIDEVEEGSCAGVQSVVLCLQHYPHLIEKLIFSFDFDFVEDNNTELILPPEIWKEQPAFYSWFNTLRGTPFILFFIADEDARYYTLMGDMVLSGELESEVDERTGRTGFSFNEEQGRELVMRVWTCCLSMMHFCYGSGFDPRIYIEGMMALMNVQFTYEELENTFLQFVEQGSFKVEVNTVGEQED